MAWPRKRPKNLSPAGIGNRTTRWALGYRLQKGVQGHNLSNKNRSGYVSSESPTHKKKKGLEDWVRAEGRAQDRWVGCRRGTNVVIENVSMTRLVFEDPMVPTKSLCDQGPAILYPNR